jgi:AP-1 complex subunit gamma-1
MSIAGNYVPDEVASNLVNLIAATPGMLDCILLHLMYSLEIHSYASQKMYMALTNDYTSQVLVQVCSWCIGEYGDLLVAPGNDREIAVTEADVVELLERIVRAATTTTITKWYLLTALMKLTTRFSAASQPRLKNLILSFKVSLSFLSPD